MAMTVASPDHLASVIEVFGHLQDQLAGLARGEEQVLEASGGFAVYLVLGLLLAALILIGAAFLCSRRWRRASLLDRCRQCSDSSIQCSAVQFSALQCSMVLRTGSDGSWNTDVAAEEGRVGPAGKD